MSTTPTIAELVVWLKREEVSANSGSARGKKFASIAARLEQAERDEAELRMIRNVCARRPALDQPTLWQNVEKAITVASRADLAEAKAERLEQALRAARDVLVAFGNQAGLVPTQNGYSATMTEAERQVCQSVHDIDAILAALAPIDTEGR